MKAAQAWWQNASWGGCASSAGSGQDAGEHKEIWGSPDKRISLFLASSNSSETHTGGHAPNTLRDKVSVTLQSEDGTCCVSKRPQPHVWAVGHKQHWQVGPVCRSLHLRSLRLNTNFKGRKYRQQGIARTGEARSLNNRYS